MKITENRRIFLNVMFTYGSSFLSICANIFVSRWVLMALGQTDLGLYSVVGGMVVFIRFFNTMLASSVARFYAISIGQAKRDKSPQSLENSRLWFNTALTIHSFLPIILISIGYPIAKWAIYNWLTIPPDRIEACVWVLRISCFSAFIGMVNVPFHAMYVAKQYISELTIYSMISTILNIIFSYFMAAHPDDWLIKYTLWICCINITPQAIICVRARLIFKECRIRINYMFNRECLRQIGSYVMWTFWGNLASIARNQLITILVNKGYGPKANSAMHIAHQVNHASLTLSSAINKAFSPSIITAFGAKDYVRMKTLAFLACKFSVILALIIVIPISLELPEVIRIWLKNPPEFTIGLCYIMMVAYICSISTTGNMIAINASGRIKEYQLVGSISSIMIVLIFSIVCISMGFSVYSIGIVLVFACAFNSAIRIYYAQKTIQLSARRWIMEIAFPVLAVMAISFPVAYIPHLFMEQCIARIFVTIIFSELVYLSAVWFIALKNQEREYISDKLRMIAKKLPLCR